MINILVRHRVSLLLAAFIYLLLYSWVEAVIPLGHIALCFNCAPQSLKFELPPWISCLFTACTALFGGRNKPNYLTKVQQDANGTFTGCSSILWLNTQQLSFLIPSDPSWVISLYFYTSQRPIAYSPQKPHQKEREFLNVKVIATRLTRLEKKWLALAHIP